jgi:hypothetical protein
VAGIGSVMCILVLVRENPFLIILAGEEGRRQHRGERKARPQRGGGVIGIGRRVKEPGAESSAGNTTSRRRGMGE